MIVGFTPRAVKYDIMHYIIIHAIFSQCPQSPVNYPDAGKNNTCALHTSKVQSAKIFMLQKKDSTFQ